MKRKEKKKEKFEPTSEILKATQSNSGIFQYSCKFVDFLWEQLGVFESLGLWKSPSCFR